MNTTCAEVDCTGTDKSKGVFCPCRKTHYSEAEVLRWWIEHNKLGKMIDGALHIYEDGKNKNWQEFEMDIKFEILESLETE